jgi:two-component system NtrC family sensor kinase
MVRKSDDASPESASGPTPPDSPEGAAARKIAELEASLESYRRTLTEIYELYDTKVEELSLIRRIGDALRTPLDLKTLCLELVDVVAHEVTVEKLGLMIQDPATGALVLRASFDGLAEESSYNDLESGAVSLTEGTAVEAARTGRPVILDAGDQGPHSRLYLPLVARNQTVGLLSLSRSAEFPFGENEVRVLTIISDHTAATLANLRLLDDLAQANVRLQASERQARETSLYLENLLEAANDVIFTLDEAGRITYVNRKIGGWGFDKDALIGKALVDLLAGPAASLPEESVLMPEVVFLSPTQGPRNVLLNISRFESAPGRETSTIVLARDITERKQLEKQLFHSEKLASIGILAAGVAHEVGNPLSAISGYTQLLQGGGASVAETREFLAAIADQAARIQRIIENLLDFSRPSAGVQSLIDVKESIKGVMAMLAGQRVFRGIDIEVDLAEDLPPLHMDRDHLTQIVVNIALNAAQAMPEGGRLTLCAEAGDGMVRLIFSDTGPGIPDEVRERIFDPFFTTKPAGQGTGLGLAICYRIVEGLGGRITCQSRPGQGATFTVTLPAAAAKRSGS